VTEAAIVSLEACLPAELQGPATTITRVAAGLSGAGVYRVDVDGQASVLKISDESEPLARWRAKLRIQQLAASAGLAPRIIHVDEARRALVSEFVVDRSFPALYGNPGTRDAAIALLGRAVRRLHDIPLPADAEGKSPREYLGMVWALLSPSAVLPKFVSEAAQRVLAEDPPAPERAGVLSHNDVNPTNLVYDGEHLLLLDWETSGPNDPYYDLAAASVFFRMDADTCKALLAAYDGAPHSAIPAGFSYLRRVVALLCGTMFLHLARQTGHAGATGHETLESTPSLDDFYQRLRSGSVSLASGEGKWLFGLVLVKAGTVQ
jgi:aminoglycoside phosphotransferase (APT) family kinase protein